MELRTYTGLWRVEKRLYKFYDINLPYSISLKQIGIFAAVTVPWLVLMTLLQVPFSAPWNVLWIAPPFLITWVANKPVAEGKTLLEFGFAQIGYVTRPRTYAALSPSSSKPAQHWVHGTSWKHGDEPDDGGERGR